NADELLKAADDDEEGGGGGPASAGPGRRPGQRSAREVFEAYAANPERAACLILRAWTWRPGKIDKAILANDGWLHKCEEPSADEAFRWAIARAARHGTSIDEAAADRLVSAVGCDLGRIDCELAKLAVAVPGKPITERLVADLTVATREEEFWEIQPSLMSGDVERALLHLQDMLEISRHDPAPLTFTYMDLAKKLHGAARGLRAGESVPSLMSRLRLWGEAGNAVVAQAKKLDPVALARLMNHIVEYTLRVRTGQADAVRGLEAITIEFAGVCRK
ncbi:MAG: DNA polymerase III subunit delta, partial [Phycisphaerales bacterium]